MENNKTYNNAKEMVDAINNKPWEKISRLYCFYVGFRTLCKSFLIFFFLFDLEAEETTIGAEISIETGIFWEACISMIEQSSCRGLPGTIEYLLLIKKPPLKKIFALCETDCIITKKYKKVKKRIDKTKIWYIIQIYKQYFVLRRTYDKHITY